MTAAKFFQITAAIGKALLGFILLAGIIVLTMDTGQHIAALDGAKYDTAKPFMDKLSMVLTFFLLMGWFVFLMVAFFATAFFIILEILGLFSTRRR